MNPDLFGSAASGSLYRAAPPGGGAAYGSWSLAVNVDGTQGGGNVGITVDFCGSALATGIQGALHAMIWFKPTDGGGGLGGPGYTSLDDGNGSGIGGNDVNCPAGEWFDAPSRAVMGASMKTAYVTVGGIEGRKGVLYFDNIHFD